MFIPHLPLLARLISGSPYSAHGILEFYLYFCKFSNPLIHLPNYSFRQFTILDTDIGIVSQLINIITYLLHFINLHLISFQKLNCIDGGFLAAKQLRSDVFKIVSA